MNAKVVPLRRPVAPNPRHPSMQTAQRDPLPLTLLERQLLASVVLSWKVTPPTDDRIDAAVVMLLGVGEEGL